MVSSQSLDAGHDPFRSSIPPGSFPTPLTPPTQKPRPQGPLWPRPPTVMPASWSLSFPGAPPLENAPPLAPPLGDAPPPSRPGALESRDPPRAAPACCQPRPLLRIPAPPQLDLLPPSCPPLGCWRLPALAGTDRGKGLAWAAGKRVPQCGVENLEPGPASTAPYLLFTYTPLIAKTQGGGQVGQKLGGPVPVPGLPRGQFTLSLLASLQTQIWLFYLKLGRGTPVHSECGHNRKATAGLKVRGLKTI